MPAAAHAAGGGLPRLPAKKERRGRAGSAGRPSTINSPERSEASEGELGLDLMPAAAHAAGGGLPGCRPRRNGEGEPAPPADRARSTRPNGAKRVRAKLGLD